MRDAVHDGLTLAYDDETTKKVFVSKAQLHIVNFLKISLYLCLW
jgi:hypothetical protein